MAGSAGWRLGYGRRVRRVKPGWIKGARHGRAHLIQFPVKSKPGEVDGDVIYWLGLIDSPMTILPGLLAACFYAGYRINKTRHAEIQAELAVKRTAMQPAD